jgi:hypothetical protein
MKMEVERERFHLKKAARAMKKVGVLCVLVLLALQAVSRAELFVQTYEPSRQDRFYSGDGKNFLGQAFNWSGVGLSSNGAWATMISPQYFVTAAHLHPAGGNTVTFYSGNTQSADARYQGTVDSWSYQTSFTDETDKTYPSDLWIGRLTTPIPDSANITSYPVLGLPTIDDYLGQMIYVYGKPQRVGRNIIDWVGATGNANPPTNVTAVMEYNYDTGSSGLGADECYLISGDSGAPSFVDWNGELALTGIHYYHSGVYDYAPPSAQGSYSGDSFVPYYIDQLDANMGGASVRVVPEPTSLALLVVFVAAVAPLTWRKRRRNAA